MFTLKDYLFETTYNWAINPGTWDDIKSNHSVTRDTLDGIPAASISTLWGTRNPKPSDKFVEEPTQRKFIIRYQGDSYLVDLGHPGSNHRNFKRVVSGSRLGSNEERKQSGTQPTEWRKIQTKVSMEKVKDLPVYSATKLWAEGGAAKPNSPFKLVPPEKRFVVKIANARYLITVRGNQKNDNNRTIQRVDPGSTGVLNRGSRK